MQQQLDQLKKYHHEKGPLSLKQRLKLLRKLKRAIHLRKNDFVAAAASDFGRRNSFETTVSEVYIISECINHSIRHLRDWIQPTKVSSELLFWPGKSEVMYCPKGVVGIISPWNYPIQLALKPIIAALAAGNRVMLKPSERTPNCSTLLKEFIDDVLGSEIAHVALGDVATGIAFSKLPFDHLFFTGSSEVGRKVMAAAAENLTPVTLELGGKSPVISHSSYSSRKLAAQVAVGKLWNAGQTCIAPDHLYVQESKLQETIESLSVELKKKSFRETDTTICNEDHWQRLLELLADAEENGAEIIVAADAPDDWKTNGDRWMPPHIISGVTAAMRVHNEEIFGPILPVIAYDNIEALTNQLRQKDHPLALYYFDKSRSRQRALLRSTLSGGVTINATMLHIAQNQLPFGGVGLSGMGAYNGRYGFEELSHQRAIFKQGTVSIPGALAKKPYKGWVSWTLMKLSRWFGWL